MVILMKKMQSGISPLESFQISKQLSQRFELDTVWKNYQRWIIKNWSMGDMRIPRKSFRMCCKVWQLRKWRLWWSFVLWENDFDSKTLLQNISPFLSWQGTHHQHLLTLGALRKKVRIFKFMQFLTITCPTANMATSKLPQKMWTKSKPKIYSPYELMQFVSNCILHLGIIAPILVDIVLVF